MRHLPTGLQEHLDCGVTTLCNCWRLTRADGVVLGFTDHDRALEFDGTTFIAFDGFEATEMMSGVGLAVDNLDVAGAINSSRLNEEDLSSGLFDNAVVEIYRVNWQAVDQRVLIRKGNLGEVTRAGQAFTAEVRGLSHYLNQPQGRLYQYVCDADLGDGRCKINIEASAYRAASSVSTSEDRKSLEAFGLLAYQEGWFTRGTILWTSGANANARMEIKSHYIRADKAVIELWQPMGRDIAIGDQFELRAGCDKLIGTCRDKFGNTINFRGFPQMPGNDFVISYPNRDDVRNDGSRLG